MAGLWRCENCGEGTGPDITDPAWRWTGTIMQHKCASVASQAGHFDCRWFGDGNGHPVAETSKEGLVLTRTAGDVVYVRFAGIEVAVKVLQVVGKRVRLAFKAPESVAVWRGEADPDRNNQPETLK